MLSISRRTCGAGLSVLMNACPYVHPKHSLFNGSRCSDHLFIHNISQLLFQHIPPFWTQILNTDHTATVQIWDYPQKTASKFTTGEKLKKCIVCMLIFENIFNQTNQSVRKAFTGHLRRYKVKLLAVIHESLSCFSRSDSNVCPTSSFALKYLSNYSDGLP